MRNQEEEPDTGDGTPTLCELRVEIIDSRAEPEDKEPVAEELVETFKRVSDLFDTPEEFYPTRTGTP